MNPEFDLAVVGAGPAGATLARLLAGRYRVLLLDRRPLWDEGPARDCDKACGGLLAPDAQRMLGAMGLAVPRSILAHPQTFLVRTLDLETGQERFYQRFYMNLDRVGFDRWLAGLVPSSVERLPGAVLRGWEETEEGVRLELSVGGRSGTTSARLLVGADGAGSTVRKIGWPGLDALPPYIAIQERFASPDPPPWFSAIFDRRLTDFYCWTIPKDGALVVGGAFRPGPEAGPAFERLREALPAFGFQLGERTYREGAPLRRPVRAGDVRLGQDRVALVGEAAGWISPSSAEGFSYAFRSALALAAALTDGLDGYLPRYRRRTRALRGNLMLKRWKSPFMYRPWLRRAVLRSGLASVRVHGPAGRDASYGEQRG
jgi:geranylgeranyl reductase